jgi:hypothetical protein
MTWQGIKKTPEICDHYGATMFYKSAATGKTRRVTKWFATDKARAKAMREAMDGCNLLPAIKITTMERA